MMEFESNKLDFEEETQEGVFVSDDYNVDFNSVNGLENEGEDLDDGLDM